MEPSDVVGYGDIAKKCDISKSAVRAWKDRYDDFPRPNYIGPATGNGSAPWWDWTEVSEWLDEHPNLGNR